MFKFAELQKEICLTCQYYNIPRRIEVIGTKMFIDFDASTGGCSLQNNFPKPYTSKPFTGSWCHYKRWIELP